MRSSKTTRLAVAGTITGIHAARLEIAAHRTARDFPESAALALPRHPDLDVIGLLRGKAHVACT